MTMIGLDYGNSNTCSAYDAGSGPQVIPWPDKGRTGPSVVYMPPDDGEPLVGRRAMAEAKDNPDFLFAHAKRLFNVNHTGEDRGHKVGKGSDGKTWFRGPNRLYSPSEIAACTIHEMLDCAEFRLKKRPDGAVLTHPAAWGTEEKNVLRDAAELAGLERIHLITEPEAAGFAYRFDKEKAIRNYVVVDWGGGTLDVAILLAGKNACDARWWDGDSVGGIDVDESIVDWLKERYREQYGVDLGIDGGAMLRLRKAAEEAKIALSTLEEVKIEVPLIETLPPRTLKETLTRSKLEELAAPHIARVIAVCQKVLDKSDLSVGNIAEVVLVGGMTNMPCVADAVGKFYGRKPRNDQDPDEAVALGAATYAAMIEKRIKPTNLIKRLDHDWGVETSNDVMYKAVLKGAEFPFKEPVEVVMTTQRDGQELVSVHILEGDTDSASRATRLVAVDIEVAPAPAGEASIPLLFEIMADGRKVVTGPSGVIYEGAPNG